MLSQTFCFWDKQQSAHSNIIQVHLTLKCTKDQSSHFCEFFSRNELFNTDRDFCAQRGFWAITMVPDMLEGQPRAP